MPRTVRRSRRCGPVQLARRPVCAIRSASSEQARTRAARQEPRLRKLKTLEAKAFDTLGLHANATAADVKAAYKELVEKHHPDANGGDRGSEERFRAVMQQAYQLLKQAGFC